MSIDRRILSFLAITFGITWSVAAIAYLLGIRNVKDEGFILLAAASMFGPAIAAIIQQRAIDRAPWSGLGLPLKGTRWSVLGFTVLIGIAIVPMALLVIELLGDQLRITTFGSASVSSDRMSVALEEIAAASADAEAIRSQMGMIASVPAGFILLGSLLSAVFAAFTFNLPFMLGEELGWRGYLFQRTMHWRGLHRVLFTGAVWGLWHAPLIAMGHNYPDHPVIGIGMMIGFCVIASFLFDWSRSRSRSIWSSCVLHGIINGSAGVMAMFAWNGHPLIGTIVGVAGLIALALLALLIVILDRTYRGWLFGGMEEEVPAISLRSERTSS